MNSHQHTGRTDNCLNAVELRKLFDPDAEPGVAAVEHLKNCPRCHKLLGCFLFAGEKPVTELFPDAEVSDTANRLEQLIEDYLTTYLERPEPLAAIHALARGIDDADRVYLGAYIGLLEGSADAGRVAKARELLGITAGEDAANEPPVTAAGWVAAVATVFDTRVTRRAAGKAESSTVIEGDYALRNGWECHVTYRGGEKTSLRLDCMGEEPPVLELIPLSPDGTLVDISRQSELSYADTEDDCPVYYLDGEQCACVGFPVVVNGERLVERVKVFTVGHY